MKKILFMSFSFMLFFKMNGQFVDLRDLKKDSMTIISRNGEKYLGKGRVKKSNDHLNFYLQEGGEKMEFDYRTLDTLYLHKNGKLVPHVYKIIQQEDNQNKIKLLEIERLGRLNLYSFVSVGGNFGSGFGGMGGGFGSSFGGIGGGYGQFTLFYLSKEDDMFVHLASMHLARSNKFVKFIQKYIDDCSEIIEKINQKSFDKKANILTVVDYYNSHCIQSN